MALERKDRVKDQTATTGTGTVTIDGVAPTGYRTITSAHTTGATVRYTIITSDFTEWEVGQGVWTAAGTTLTRVTVYASSNAGALVSFSAGTKIVFTGPTAAYSDVAPTLGWYSPSADNIRTGNSVTIDDTLSVGASIFATGGSGPAVTSSLIGMNAATLFFVNSANTANNRIVDFNSAGSNLFDMRVINDAYGAGTTGYRLEGGYASGITNHYFYTSAASGASKLQFHITHVADAVNYTYVQGAAATAAPAIVATGSDTNVSFSIIAKGTGGVNFYSSAGGQLIFAVARGGTDGRYVSVTSSSTNPTISTSAGSLAITPAVVMASTLTTLGGATFHATSSALTDGAGVGAGTITNAPAAGNPTKWVGINDNGTTRYIPAW